ncbi:hypothetical protein D3C87_1582970 [compost metagenome]
MEGLAQVVVLVGRVFLGQMAFVGKSHQLAASLGQCDVKPLRVNLALAGQVLEQREQAVEGLQQVEVGNIRHPRLPR